MIKMKYKGYEFEVNPKDISIKMSKNITKSLIPFCHSISEETGITPTIISGKAYFVGEDSMKKVFDLMRIYNKKGSDYLFVPDSNPIKAYFSKLEIHYSAPLEKVEYSFEFVEEYEEKSDTFDFHYTSARSGENLFDVANRTGISIEKIVSLNDYGDVFAIKEGDRVWLS